MLIRRSMEPMEAAMEAMELVHPMELVQPIGPYSKMRKPDSIIAFSTTIKTIETPERFCSATSNILRHCEI